MKGVMLIAAACMALTGCGEKTERLGREFSSMNECMTFIGTQIGPLKVITDTPGDISGWGDQKLFFRCEARMTGTRGLLVEGRWSFPAFDKK